MRRLGVNGAAMVLLLALIVAACGGSSASDAAPPAPTTTTATPDAPAAPAATSPATTAAPSTTSTSAAPATTQSPTTTAAPTDEEIEAAIIDAYLQGWDDFYRLVADPGQLDDNFISDFNTNATLENYIRARDDLADAGQRIQWPASSQRTHRPEVLEIATGQAIVRDCFSNDSFVVYNDGSTAQEGLETSIWAVSMTFEDGVWKSETTEKLASEEGLWDCGNS